MLKYDKIFISFAKFKLYINSLTSVKIAIIKSHGIVTNCLNAGLFDFFFVVMWYVIRCKLHTCT